MPGKSYEAVYAEFYAARGLPIFDYTIEVMKTDQFQSNPKGYLDSMAEKWSNTDLCRITVDPKKEALSFFRKNL